MITIHCDMCGKELNVMANERCVVDIYGSKKESKSYDLCYDCANKIQKFITEESQNDTKIL